MRLIDRYVGERRKCVCLRERERERERERGGEEREKRKKCVRSVCLGSCFSCGIARLFSRLPWNDFIQTDEVGQNTSPKKKEDDNHLKSIKI